MNKRDTIFVIFRIVAIFVLFSALGNIFSQLYDWVRMRPPYESFIIHFFMFLFVVGIPALIAFLLWNRSDWIVEQILAPFEMDELLPEDESEPSDEQLEVTHLTRGEIESLVFTAIGIWTIISAGPALVKELIFTNSYGLTNAFNSTLVELIIKLLISLWLVFRSSNIVMWLNRIRMPKE